MAEGTNPQEATKPKRTFAEFLQSTPPNTTEELVDVVEVSKSGPDYVAKPVIRLHCEYCEGERFFTTRDSSVPLLSEDWKNCFLDYFCRNCRRAIRTFSLAVCRKDDSGSGAAMKYGELPEFGPPTPARVITLIGPDREMFLQGRRAENQGFGIGSFAYYRRVVDDQKGRIIHEIARASAKLGASKEMLDQLARAEKETQFKTAIDQIKDGIPAALMIQGHNPLTLLHTALSQGLHEQTDHECLHVAQEIRLILTELAERISQALKEERELKEAVSRLMNRNRKPRETSS